MKMPIKPLSILSWNLSLLVLALAAAFSVESAQAQAPAPAPPRAIMVEPPPSPNDQARYLAGLSLAASPLESLTAEGEWREHSAQFERAWQDLDARQLSKIRQWMPAMLGYVYSDPSPLFYMFSGPDFLYANAFYPNASSYILCGQEPVGPIPDVGALSPGSRASGLRTLRSALNAILSFSFFITKDMKTDLNQSQLSGTLPVLYVFLARAGARIQDVELVKLDDAGEFTTGKSKHPGVKIRFLSASGKAQTLYYFTTDLSNYGIKQGPGFMAFCQKQGQGNGFAKAASYLMHSDNFTGVRDFLLGNTRNYIEDDSGIPYRFFKPENWVVSVYGHYPGPIPLFQQYYQRDLDSAFLLAPAPKLPFGVGYQWKPGISSLIVATSLKSVPKALPVQ